MKLMFRLVSAAVFLTAVLAPIAVEPQCVVIYSSRGTIGSNVYVIKSLATLGLCHATNTNALSCWPGATPVTASVFQAVANPALTVNPYCHWSCACGHVTIDGSDGLPVELMSFTVDDDPSPQ